MVVFNAMTGALRSWLFGSDALPGSFYESALEQSKTVWLAAAEQAAEAAQQKEQDEPNAEPEAEPEVEPEVEAEAAEAEAEAKAEAEGEGAVEAADAGGEAAAAAELVSGEQQQQHEVKDLKEANDASLTAALEAEAEREARATQHLEYERTHRQWSERARRSHTCDFHFGQSTPGTHRTDLFYTPTTAAAAAAAKTSAALCKPMGLRVTTTIAPDEAKRDSNCFLIDLEAGKTSKPFSPAASAVRRAWVFTKPAYNPSFLSSREEKAHTERFLAGQVRGAEFGGPAIVDSECSHLPSHHQQLLFAWLLSCLVLRAKGLCCLFVCCEQRKVALASLNSPDGGSCGTDMFQANNNLLLRWLQV